MQQRLQQRKKPARRFRIGILATAAAWAAAAAFSSAAGGTALPLDSSLFFVLNGTISSRAKAGTLVPARLKDPIVVGGVTVAPRGAPVEIEITQTQAARSGNIDGSADIYFEPLTLANGLRLPLVTPTSHLTPHMSVGQTDTRNVTDTLGDIFIPYHVIYHIFRKGADIRLGPGTVIRARTAATLTLANGAIAISTPPPLETSFFTPRPAFVPAPLATPPGYVPPTPKPSPSATPTHAP